MCCSLYRCATVRRPLYIYSAALDEIRQRTIYSGAQVYGPSHRSVLSAGRPATNYYRERERDRRGVPVIGDGSATVGSLILQPAT